jgi:phage/plasmid-like protein (TIGR03299 family)
MSHDVETMMYSGQTPWHGLGTRVVGKITSEEAIKVSGLDWTVGLGDLRSDDGVLVSHKVVRRSTDNTIFGVVGPKYTPLQNVDAFSFFDPFIQNDAAMYEAAGNLQDGKKIWVQARLTGAPLEIVKGDEVDRFLLLSNTHNGTQALRVGLTPVRVVCQNTLAQAYSDDDSQLLRIVHHKKIKDTLKMVQDAVNVANRRFEASAEQYRELARHQVNKDDLSKFVVEVFFNNYDPDQTKWTNRQATAVQEMDQTIHRLFESGTGNNLKHVRGTWWAAYNAVTEYLTYDGDKEETDKRLDSLWFGSNASINDDALDTALEFALR